MLKPASNTPLGWLVVFTLCRVEMDTIAFLFGISVSLLHGTPSPVNLHLGHNIVRAEITELFGPCSLSCAVEV